VHYLQKVETYINQSHSHLGSLVAVSMLATKAKKCLIVIAPSGCGKSRSSSFVASQFQPTFTPDRLTMAGLKTYEKVFNDFRGLVVIDDIATGFSSYTRLATISSLARLVCEHSLDSGTATAHYRIDDFTGSAVINCQPVLFRQLVSSPEWEAQVADKTIRYYHLYRPWKPGGEIEGIKLNWGIPLNEVAYPDVRYLLYKKLANLVSAQWSVTRVRDNLNDLLRASASLDSRRRIGIGDYNLLLRLLKPMVIERYCMVKEDFEKGRAFLSGLLYLLTEFATYQKFPIRQLMDNYKVSQSTAYRIMGKYSRYWEVVEKNPTVYAPSKELKNILNEVM